jgi:phenylpyruvate tautomerase PptA (4-oxalocrotonate tautomerase family)
MTTCFTYSLNPMPFVHTYINQTTAAMVRAAVVDAIHHALVTGIGMPMDELFNLVHLYDAENFHYSRTFNGVARSDNLVVIEITMRRGRSDAMKQSLYAAIAENMSKIDGISTRDIFIFMHENDYSDWSVGNGKFAMKLVQQAGEDQIKA